MFGCQEAVATCTGEQADSQTSTHERADWDHELGNAHHQTEMELRCAHWNQTETGSSGSARGRLAAGGVRNTKGRDAPALEVRAGTPGVGRTPGMLQG